jgi:hypothetical protein
MMKCDKGKLQRAYGLSVEESNEVERRANDNFDYVIKHTGPFHSQEQQQKFFSSLIFSAVTEVKYEREHLEIARRKEVNLWAARDKANNIIVSKEAPQLDDNGDWTMQGNAFSVFENADFLFGITYKNSPREIKIIVKGEYGYED